MSWMDWSKGKYIELEHRLMQGNTVGELAELYDVTNNLLRRIMRNNNIPLPKDTYDVSMYGRKERHIEWQLRRLRSKGVDVVLADLLPVPSMCPFCGAKLTYNIYSEENNNATVVVDEQDGEALIVSKIIAEDLPYGT